MWLNYVVENILIFCGNWLYIILLIFVFFFKGGFVDCCGEIKIRFWLIVSYFEIIYVFEVEDFMMSGGIVDKESIW